MIFYGELSAKCKNYLIKRYQRINIIALCPGILFFASLFLIVAIKVHPAYYIAAVSSIGLFGFAFFPISKKTLDSLCPTKVIIEDDLIVSQSDSFYETRDLKQIKEIRDYGEWYSIIFNYGHNSEKFICQKNLIIQGSIQDFDTMFKNKIKIINKNER